MTVTRTTTETRALRGATVAGAAGAGLAVWVLAVPVLGVELAARTGNGTLIVGPASVAFAGVVAALAGWGLLALLERAGRGRGGWTAVAVTALVISLAGPLVQATTVAAGAVLVAMHVAVGTTIVVALGRTARTGRRGRVSGNWQAHEEQGEEAMNAARYARSWR